MRLGSPETDIDAVLGVEAGDRHVVGDGQNALATLPVVLVVLLPDPAAETDVVGDVRPFDLERVSVGQPVVRNFDLVAVDNLLLEDAVLVTDTVAPRSVVEGRQGIWKQR